MGFDGTTRDVRRQGFVLAALAAVLLVAAIATAEASAAPPPVKSLPRDTSSVSRPARASDVKPRIGVLPANTTLVDPIVSNTDATLTTTDTFSDSEPSIAPDPSNPNRVVIEGFSGCWVLCGTTNAPLFTSIDGGVTWTKSFTVPPPPGGLGVSGCPCDQAPDYGRTGTMFSSFLTEGGSPAGHVYTGSTTDPTNAAAWSWNLSGGVATQTNVGTADSDQPWMRVNRSPANAAQDDTYVAYDDFGVSPPGLHVAVAPGTAPPNFTIDHTVGTGPSCCVNPGLRLAPDPATGTTYVLWEKTIFSAGTFTVQYFLNRSTDGGNTWTLNGNAGGIQVASATSDQATNSQNTAQIIKFGTVNRLLGGIDSAAVDPNTGDVYYAYGAADGTGVSRNNQILVKRLTPNGSGGLNVPGSGTVVSGSNPTQAALPSVAVASDGAVGVLYDRFDGFDGGGFPIFTAHFGLSTDHGASYNDTSLYTFSSPAKDDGSPTSRQRVLGDYQQVKTVGQNFYGTFTGNGSGLGRPSANTDPIYFTIDRTPPDTNITSGPADGSTTNAQPTFDFASTESNSTFECSVDSSTYAACSGPDTLGPLSDGPHTFLVRAVDHGGNTDPSAASRSFTVDATAPVTRIVKGPKKKTKKRIAKFKFTSNEPGSTFQCKIDRKPFKPCSSPKKFKRLKRRKHVFRVQAIDAVGNIDATPAKKAWKIKKKPRRHH